MTDPIAFLLACMAVLFVPGPTNTLLATSGATVGFGRSLPLAGAELVGYTLAIWILALLLAPLVQSSEYFSAALRLACGAYLIWSAVHLWREGSSALTNAKGVTFRRVLITTLLNPKAILFALVIIPYLGERKFAEAAPYLIAHLAITLAASMLWMGLGAFIGSSARGRIDPGVIRRLGATALGAFGVVLSSSGLAMAGVH